jgi:hypothetical protein
MLLIVIMNFKYFFAFVQFVREVISFWQFDRSYVKCTFGMYEPNDISPEKGDENLSKICTKSDQFFR